MKPEDIHLPESTTEAQSDKTTLAETAPEEKEAKELKFPSSSKKADWQPLFPKIINLIAEKKHTLDNGGYNAAKVIAEKIKETEEISDKRLLIFKNFDIKKRATVSGTKETG